MGRLEGKTILVTGANGDIGRATTAAIAAEGGNTVATDLQGQGDDHHALDITDEKGWTALAAHWQASGMTFDGLVNCAGIGAMGDLASTTFAQWRHVMAVNLDGTFLSCKFVLPLMKARGGSVVNIASVFGKVGRANMLAYSASKGGVIQLTRSLALYGATQKPQIRCNAICPAFLDGKMMADVIDNTKQPDLVRQVMSREIPVGRFGSAAEVAALAVYLLSDDSRFVTGTEIAIDGGYAAR